MASSHSWHYDIILYTLENLPNHTILHPSCANLHEYEKAL
jgi:hypothetical protein